MSHGIDRYPGKKKHDLRVEEKRAGQRRLHEESAFNELWRTIPGGQVKSEALLNLERRRKLLGLTVGKGLLTGWNPDAVGSTVGVSAVSAGGGGVQAGGAFTKVHGVNQQGIARFK